MNSVPYYDKNGIRITKGIFELPDGKQYTIKNINSVSIKHIQPNRKKPIICIIFGILAGATSHWLIGLLIIGLGIWWWISQKISHWIFLKTSSTEDDAYGSHNLDEINEIRSALNAAIEAY